MTRIFTIILLAITISISAQSVNIEGDPYNGNPYATITDAVNAAEAGDVILISGVHTEVVSFGKSITLRGSDPTNDIIQSSSSPSNDGSGESVVSVIRDDDADVLNVTIENLGIRYGNAGDNGGGINVDKVTDMITLKNLIIEDNFSDSNGGGIGIAGSNAELINCTIRNNESTLDGGGLILAPNNGAEINSVIDIKQSLIDNNISRNGGGIYINGNNNFGNDYTIDVNVENSTISNNDTFSPGGGAGGGAVWCKGALWTTNAGGDGTSGNVTLQLIHATVYNNTHTSSVKNGLRFSGPSGVETNFSAFNSIIVTADDPGEKAINFINSNTTDIVNSILGGLQNGGSLFPLIDDAAKNNVRGKTSTFAGITSGLSDQGGSTQVLAIDENSTSDDYCTAATSVSLPDIDQRGYFREGVSDAGAFEFGGTMSSDNFVTPEFYVYPNPTSDFINIEESNTTVKEVKVYSITGKLHIQTTKKRINISNLAKGIYLVKINTHANKLITKKIVKN
jgi:hypothetical protein